MQLRNYRFKYAENAALSSTVEYSMNQKKQTIAKFRQ